MLARLLSPKSCARNLEVLTIIATCILCLAVLAGPSFAGKPGGGGGGGTPTLLTFTQPNGLLASDYGSRQKNTRNVTVSFPGDSNTWQSGYGNLSYIVYSQSGRMTITLKADPGYTVNLLGFDMGMYGGGRWIQNLRVEDGSGNRIWVGYNQPSYLPEYWIFDDGTAHYHAAFETQPLSGSTLVIVMDSSMYAQYDSEDCYGIDNISFSQTPAPSNPVSPPFPAGWYKGNLHCHTNGSSDADSRASTVANWYKSNGYHFISFSDHNIYTAPISVSGLTIIPGEEISSWDPHSDHVGAYGIDHTLYAASGLGTDVATIQANISSCNSAGGWAVVNHPNYQWALNVAGFKQLTGANLFELWNGVQGCDNPGDATHPSTEANWDSLLSSGYWWYGLASDDAHHFASSHQGPDYYNPGTGWIVVKAPSSSAADLSNAIKQGKFYSVVPGGAACGIVLSNASFDGTNYRITVSPVSGVTYTIQFIGQNGNVLQQVNGMDATYVCPGNAPYVRAKITGSEGSRAWTQPVKPGVAWP